MSSDRDTTCDAEWAHSVLLASDAGPGSCGRGWCPEPPRWNRAKGDSPLKVREAMSSDVWLANPDRTIREAAQMMADQDIGALPVGENDRLVGIITDRDIAVRAV